MRDGSPQLVLLDAGRWWENYWRGMPEFVMEDLEPFRTVYVHFESAKDVDEFSKLVDQKIPSGGPAGGAASIWFPRQGPRRFANKEYVDPSDDTAPTPFPTGVDELKLEESEFDEGTSAEEARS